MACLGHPTARAPLLLRAPLLSVMAMPRLSENPLVSSDPGDDEGDDEGDLDLFRDGNWFDGDQSDASDAEDFAGQRIYTKAAQHHHGTRLRGRQKQQQERQQQRQARPEATQRQEQQQQSASPFVMQEQTEQQQQQSQQQQQQQQQPQQQHELPDAGPPPPAAAQHHQHHQQQLGSASIGPATTINNPINLNLCQAVLLRGKRAGSVCLSKSTVPGEGKCGRSGHEGPSAATRTAPSRREPEPTIEGDFGSDDELGGGTDELLVGGAEAKSSKLKASHFAKAENIDDEGFRRAFENTWNLKATAEPQVRFSVLVSYHDSVFTAVLLHWYCCISTAVKSSTTYTQQVIVGKE